MSQLNVSEGKAITKVSEALADDVRAFDFKNATPEDIADLLGYAYSEICATLRKAYEDDIPF